MTTYGILVFDGVQELDFVGPWEVFTVSGMVRQAAASSGATGAGAGTETGEESDLAVTIAAEDRPVRGAKGLRVLPDHTFTDHPPLDVVLVPGGQGTRREAENPVLLEWLAKVGAGAQWVTSVCTGSLLLVASGLAAGRRVATHWSFEDKLAQRGDCTVVRDARWVRDGDVVSSQGVSAGIDMALWLVGQLHDPAHARAVQRYIQYDPAPPYQADV
jgi:transcriptional regulator GlxA family with amidase domain